MTQPSDSPQPSTPSPAAADRPGVTTSPAPHPSWAAAAARDADRLCTQLGIMQGFVVGGTLLAVAGVALTMPMLIALGAGHAALGATLWWRRFGLAVSVPAEMRTWSNDGTRPLAAHELRRVEKRLAWQYGHDLVYRYGPCWSDAAPASARHLRRLACRTCWKRRLDGTHRRRREAARTHRDATPMSRRVR